MKRLNAWKSYDEVALADLEKTAAAYRKYLDAGKTERECAAETIEIAKAAGYTDLKAAIKAGTPVKPGDKLYLNVMDKAVLMFYMGEKPLTEGVNIVGAHIDSPRIDVKQNPFYESDDIAYADTHYYGGIKKYQWVAQPLALHGVVAKKDGTLVKICIGEKPEDPVVGVSDLLIHLSADQMKKDGSKVVEGENLDVILCGRPLQDTEEKDAVMANLLAILKDQYGIEEADMYSAEIEVVPAGACRDFGLDRSMLLGYGHDDRVCAFASMQAILSLTETPAYTCCCMLVDKEEIGSVGATGMQARYYENAIAELLVLTGIQGDLAVRRCLANSRMLSCDVSAGYDPLYAAAFEKKNAAMLGYGVCYNKFTGSRGKSGSNDANAEFIGRLRKIMDDNNVTWQTAELGKVDVGGGGTIAYICALYGMEVIDSGVPVLSMHAPYEIINKADLYEAVKAYTAFMKEAAAAE